jgi:hypothetical protein
VREFESLLLRQDKTTTLEQVVVLFGGTWFAEHADNQAGQQHNT